MKKLKIIIIFLVIFFVSAGFGFAFGLGANFLMAKSFDWFRNLSPEKTFGEKNILSPSELKELKNESKSEYRPQSSHEEKVISAVKKAQDAVVSVIATKDLPIIEQYYTDPFDNFNNSPFNDPFFSPFQFKVPRSRQKGTEKKQVSAGSGFIISKDGMILTNKHVVEIEDAEYTVLTNNGDKYSVKILAKDPVQDLALLKVEKKNLPFLKFGNSDILQSGQSVIAIGNALGEFKNTVSVGVVSGLRRTVTASSGLSGESETLEGIIQTDAAINQGNSGGPLLNLDGEVIGINTAVAAGAQNIGFAIPINQAKKDIEDVKNGGKISIPFMGVRYVLVNEAIKKNNNLSVDYGALVLRGEKPEDLAVVPGSPANKAGIVENDIILEINDKKITQENSLAKLVQQYKVGDEIKLKILSKGSEKTVRVKLEERK